jgi:hypothetical protein
MNDKTNCKDMEIPIKFRTSKQCLKHPILVGVEVKDCRNICSALVNQSLFSNGKTLGCPISRLEKNYVMNTDWGVFNWLKYKITRSQNS